MFVAETIVETSKASRYLKALCNHFAQKVTAEYRNNRGTVQFGFGYCELVAEYNTLIIRIKAENESNLARVKHVVGDHLIRFGSAERLVIAWEDNAEQLPDD